MTRRHWVLLVGGVLLVVLVGFGLLDRFLERTLRAPVNAYLRDRTLALLRVEGPTGLTIALPYLDLKLVRRTLELHEVRIRYDRKVDGKYTRFEAVAPNITLSGLDISDLVWHRDFRLSGVRLTNPVIRYTDEGPPDTSAAAAAAAAAEDTLAAVFPAPDSLIYRVVANWLPADVRGGRIDHLIVEHASFVNRVQRGPRTTLDSTIDLNLAMQGLQLDSTRHRVFEHGTLTLASLTHIVDPAHDTVFVERASIAVGLGDTAYSIGMARTGPGGNAHVLRVVGMARSQAHSMLTIDTLAYAPRDSDPEFFRGVGRRTTRVRALGTGIVLTGLHQADIRNRRVTPDHVTIGTMDLDVVADQRQEAVPRARADYWPARLAGLPWTVGADTVTLKEGAIRYGEMRPDQPKLAEVEFDKLRATITNATNDTAHSGDKSPMIIRASGRIYGRGTLQTTIAVAVRPGPLAVQVEGKAGSMTFVSFNRFLIPANGIQMTSGEIEEAEFSFRVMGGLATGTFASSYHDLDLSVINSVTRKQNLGAKLKTFMAGIMLRGSSAVDKRGVVKPAPIHYEVDPSETFWGILWEALRSGIVKQVKK